MEFDIYFRFLAVLVFVLALIGLLTWLVRRFGPAGRVLRARGGRRRLEIVEIVPIDAKRRLVLVRCDRTEHLIMLGTTNDILIEAGIGAASDHADKEDAA